jgi:hypothetical protein
MTVVQAGSINTTALIVPDAYIQVVPPQTALLNGVPTNILGVVGTAQWGPVNAPTIVGSMQDYATNFGAIQNRKYDMGTQVAAAVLQGASNFRCVRVTDGTDTAASVAVQTNCITFTSKYTGSLGNNAVVTLAAGSAANTWRVSVGMPGFVSEVFDNIGEGLTGGPLWAAIAGAINNGVSGLRGPSALVTATAGAGTTTPTAASFTLSGGTDGAGVAATALVGQDTIPRSGMYALRNTGASVAFLADCDTSSTWTTQVSFGLSEGIYMIGVGPSSDSISNAVSVKGTAGIDSYAFKLLFGDWIYFADGVNGVTRLISPQGFVAGKLSNLSPEQSSLNKQLYGIVGTQSSYTNKIYSAAELQALGQAGIDLICNPVPGGKYFGARFGHNSSSNAVINGDNYTRLTNYIAYTLNAGMGQYIGQLQSTTTRAQAKATIDNFLSNMEQQNMIGAVNGGPAFKTVLDATNNPSSRVALGYMQADVQVVYLSVIEKFLINVEGSQSTVIRQSTTPQS